MKSSGRTDTAAFAARPALAPAAGTVEPAPGAPAAVTSTIDRTSKASVTDAYRSWLLPALSVPSGWTGSVTACDPGTTSTATEDATISAVNYFREMAGLTPVTIDHARTAAQRIPAP